jgi:hypothetical protein
MRSSVLIPSLLLFFLALLFAFITYAELSDTDTDGDGWPDQYETKLGANPNNAASVPSALEDPDQDGLRNIEELDAGTDPMDPDSDNDRLSDAQEAQRGDTDPWSKDTDKDGSSDYNEVLIGSDPSHPDTDGDGWLDGAEIDALSDPLSQTSTPKNP